MTICIVMCVICILALGTIVSLSPLDDVNYRGWSSKRFSSDSPYTSPCYLGWALASVFALVLTGVLPAVSWFATYRFSLSSAVCMAIFIGKWRNKRLFKALFMFTSLWSCQCLQMWNLIVSINIFASFRFMMVVATCHVIFLGASNSSSPRWRLAVKSQVHFSACVWILVSNENAMWLGYSFLINHIFWMCSGIDDFLWRIIYRHCSKSGWKNTNRSRFSGCIVAISLYSSRVFPCLWPLQVVRVWSF